MSHLAASIDLTLLHEMPLDRSPDSGLTAFWAMVRKLHGRKKKTFELVALNVPGLTSSGHSMKGSASSPNFDTTAWLLLIPGFSRGQLQRPPKRNFLLTAGVHSFSICRSCSAT